MFPQNPKTARVTKVVLSILVLSPLLTGAVALAWAEPAPGPGVPPGNNVPAPLNISVTGQAKAGSLGVATNGLDPAYGLTSGSDTDRRGIKATGNSFFEKGVITFSPYTLPAGFSGANGMIYYDGIPGVNRFRCYENGSWTNCIGGGGGGGDNGFGKIADAGGTERVLATVANDVLKMTAGSGLAVSYDAVDKGVNYGLITCIDGKILKVSGGNWTCQDDSGGGGALPGGAVNQTLRRNAAAWEATSALLNNGSQVNISGGAGFDPNYRLMAIGDATLGGIKAESASIQPAGYFNNSSSGFAIQTLNGGILFNSLSGGGTRMVVANNSGLLSKQQVVPSDGFAPADAEYVVMSLNNTLTQERRLVTGSGISFNDGGANSNLTVSLIPCVDGKILKVSGGNWTCQDDQVGGGPGGIGGSGIATQVAFFTGATNIGSSSNLYWDSTNFRLGINQSYVGLAAKLVVNNPTTALKYGSSGDAIYAYANSTNSAISAEQAGTGYAGYFSGRVTVIEPTTNLYNTFMARGGNGLKSSLIFGTLRSAGGNAGGSIGHDGATNTLFFTGNTSGGATKHMVINTLGNVGIGQALPGARLAVYNANIAVPGKVGSAGDAIYAYARSNNAAISAEQGLLAGVAGYFSHTAGGLALQTASGGIRFNSLQNCPTIGTNNQGDLTCGAGAPGGLGFGKIADAGGTERVLATVANDVLKMTAGSGLSVSYDGANKGVNYGLITCIDGKILKASGGNWTCQDDQTGTGTLPGGIIHHTLRYNGASWADTNALLNNDSQVNISGGAGFDPNYRLMAIGDATLGGIKAESASGRPAGYFNNSSTGYAIQTLGGNILFNSLSGVGTRMVVANTSGVLSTQQVVPPNGFAPADAQYVVLATHAGLINERVLAAGSGISIANGAAKGNSTVSLSNPAKSCAAGNAIQSFDLTGAGVACIPTGGGGGVTSITAGNGLVAVPNPIIAIGTISLMPCASGQILKVSGASWACGIDLGGGGGSNWNRDAVNGLLSPIILTDNVGIGTAGSSGIKLFVLNTTTSIGLQTVTNYAGTTNIGIQSAAFGGTVWNRGGEFTASGGTGFNIGVSGSASNSGSNNFAVYGQATGGSGTKYALYGSAEGAGTNWGLYISSGKSYFADNVGIGSAAFSPSEKLQVVGNIKMGAAGGEGNIMDANAITGFNDLYLRGNSTESAAVYVAGSEISLYTNPGPGSVERIRIYSGGNVMIGPALPGFSNGVTRILNVNGGIVAEQGEANFASGCNNQGGYSFDENCHDTGLFSNGNGNLSLVSNQRRAIVVENGNAFVGINMPQAGGPLDNPQYGLDVNGSFRLRPLTIVPNGANGAMYYDGGAGVNKFRCYEGGSWKNCISGGGGGAPADAQYVVAVANPALANGRVLSAGSGISVSFVAAGIATVTNTSGIIANKGLQVNASKNFGIIDCADGQIMKYNAAGQWACAADNSGGPGFPGAANQTLRYGAAGWVATNNLLNDDTSISMGGGPDVTYRLTVSGAALGGIKAESASGQPAGYFSNTAGGPIMMLKSSNVPGGAGGPTFFRAITNTAAAPGGRSGFTMTTGASGDVKLLWYDLAGANVLVQIMSQGDIGFNNASGVAIGSLAVTPGYKLDVFGNERVAGNMLIGGNLTTNGNIGFGVAPTGDRLRVGGNISASGDICTDLAGGRCLSTVGGGSGVVSGTQNYVAKFTTAAGTTVGNSIIFDNGSRVGIGTSAPEDPYKLDVNGLAAFRPGSGKIYITNPRAGTGFVLTTNDANNWRADIIRMNYGLVLATGAASGIPPIIMTINNNGNVGIGLPAGVTMPNFKLDVVNGDINTTGVYRRNGIAGVNASCALGQTFSGFTVSGGIVTANGACTAISGGGTVTSITQGTGMTFSVTPITTTGTIGLNITDISTCTNATTKKIIWNAGGRLACADDQNSGGVTATDGVSGRVAVFSGANSIDGDNGLTYSTSNGGTLTVSKITANTIDPVYKINGKKYATYVADFAGGVRTETAGIVSLSQTAKEGEYLYTINFATLSEGTNLWLFWNTSNKNLADVTVVLTAGFKGKVWYEKAGTELRIYGEKAGEVSYSLSAPRVDYKEWGNSADSQSAEGIDVLKY